MNRLRLRRLRAFHVVMIGGSVTAAAERLSLPKPAISENLIALKSRSTKARRTAKGKIWMRRGKFFWV